MANVSPQRFAGRVGKQADGRIRRVLNAAGDSRQRNGDTLEVAPDGRLEVRVAKGGPLRLTRRGLELDPAHAGEMNRPQLKMIRDPDSGASAADLREKLIEILDELRRTGHMRSGGV